MIERTVARRYAASMLLVSEAAGITEEIESQLLALKDAFLRDSNFQVIMMNPRISKKSKREVLQRIFKDKSHPAFMKFLEILVDRNRFGAIVDIADTFDELADEFKGIVRAKVRTFLPLSEEQKKVLHAKLTRIVGGRKLEMTVEVDRELLGGMWVKIGDTLIDGSVASKLKYLREKMMEGADSKSRRSHETEGADSKSRRPHETEGAEST